MLFIDEGRYGSRVCEMCLCRSRFTETIISECVCDPGLDRCVCVCVL